MTDVHHASSLLEELNRGRPAWPLLADFPEQDEEDAAKGTAAVHEATEVLRGLVDVPEVERTRSLPPDWVKPLRDAGLYALTTPASRGGRGLSPYNAYRVISALARHSVPPAVSVAVHTGFGSSAYLPLLPDGPLKDTVAAADAAQVISGDADTEPTGAANWRRATTARLDEQGTHYVLDGQKVYIQNAPWRDCCGSPRPSWAARTTDASASSSCPPTCRASPSGSRTPSWACGACPTPRCP